MRIPESELIINDRGAIYHLNLRPEEIADTIITVGDPQRVTAVSKHFDEIYHSAIHREFITHTGRIGAKNFSVVSTGIGPDNIDIVLNELDALVNIDFESRTVNSQLRSLDIVRIGTAGSLQKDVPVDSYVASTFGLGIDNLMNFYGHAENEEEKQILHAFVTYSQLHQSSSNPYITGASGSLLRHFVEGFERGITVTCPGFYGPQGRLLRAPLRQPDFISRLSGFAFGQHRVCNFEMETAAIYGLGKMLGHHCLSLSAIVANRVTGEFAANPARSIDSLIHQTLETLTSIPSPARII